MLEIDFKAKKKKIGNSYFLLIPKGIADSMSNQYHHIHIKEILDNV